MGKILMIITLAALFTACPLNQSGEFDFEAFFAEFQEKKFAWENLNIDYYKFVYISSVQRDGYIPMWNPPLTITVFPDKTPEITAIDVWAVGELPEWLSAEKMADLDYLLEEFAIPPTITQIYSDIEQEIQTFRHHESPYFAAYDIVYNKYYHYPEYYFARPMPGVGSNQVPMEITAFEDLRHK